MKDLYYVYLYLCYVILWANFVVFLLWSTIGSQFRQLFISLHWCRHVSDHRNIHHNCRKITCKSGFN